MPLYCAWVADGSAAFDASLHQVSDPDLLSATLTLADEVFAQAALTFKRPPQGWLTTGRIWAILSYAEAGKVAMPLFKGRLSAPVLGPAGGTITVEITAAPEDAPAQLAALATASKVAPYWHALATDDGAAEDPSQWLAARTASLHWHPVIHIVMLTDWFSGDLIDLSTGYIGLSVEQVEAPLAAVNLLATIEWEQRARGRCDLSRAIAQAFGGVVSTYTPNELEHSWPRPGALGGDSGWCIEQADLDKIGVGRSPVLKTFITVAQTPSAGGGTRATRTIQHLRLQRFDYAPYVSAGFRYNQKRQELLRARVAQSLQADLGAAREETLEVTLADPSVDSITPNWAANTAYAPGDHVRAFGRVFRCLDAHISGPRFLEFRTTFLDDGGLEVSTQWSRFADADEQIPLEDASPLGLPARPAFLSGALPGSSGVDGRAAEVIGYLLRRCRRRLAESARAIRLTVSLPFAAAAGLTLADRVRLQPTPRLPGGAIGKLVRIVLEWNVQIGVARGTITLACSLGAGAADPAGQPGDPAFVTDDALADGVQDRSGARFAIGDGLVWGFDHMDPLDEPVNLAQLSRAHTALIGLSVGARADVQFSHVRAGYDQASSNQFGQLQELLRERPSRLRFALRPLGSADTISRTIKLAVAAWPAPKEIDLSALA